ncbi:hypothetical protein F4776DRAFT_668815 [Hypoxylon sp. NC0597]|nr:hypothetical protein F4776DRAFT_668815 [Hypoxylon sp. NC0597]
MRLINTITYVFPLAIVIPPPASAFPVGISTSKVTGIRPPPVLPPTPSSRRWDNGSQTPSDPQVFCRSEFEAPIFTTGDEDLGGPGVLI